MNAPIYLSAREAAAELAVRPATLYAYVSRGLIRSTPGPGRQRRYHAEDVRALQDKRGSTPPSPDKVFNGDPILETKLTLISEQGPVYRGHQAVSLARSSSLEAVATLLWDCADDPFSGSAPAPIPLDLSALRPIERITLAFATWPTLDRSAYTLSPRLLRDKGASLLRFGLAALLRRDPSATPAHQQVAASWGVTDPAHIGLLRAALVLSADHELNTSAFAVRCAASTRAPLHAALLAGLGAFSGPRHGAAPDRVEDWLGTVKTDEDIEAIMQQRLQHGETLPGFGNSVYQIPDPRALCLLEMIKQARIPHPLAARLDKIVAAADALFGRAPNIDFSLAAIRHILDLPQGAATQLFCAGRLAGWIAHALEQYERPDQIRPRATYIGERPK